jgi:hypothetical protein
VAIYNAEFGALLVAAAAPGIHQVFLFSFFSITRACQIDIEIDLNAIIDVFIYGNLHY